jgi:hypothetical protein
LVPTIDAIPPALPSLVNNSEELSLLHITPFQNASLQVLCWVLGKGEIDGAGCSEEKKGEGWDCRNSGNL